MIFEGPHLMKGVAHAYARQRVSGSGRNRFRPLSTLP
jgi:hypothetical protein